MNGGMPPASRGQGTWPARAAAAVLVVLGFVPFAAFLDTGLEMPWLGAQLREWGTGSLLTLGIGVLAWLASSRGHWPSFRPRRSHPWSLDTRLVLVALSSLILYVLVATFVFSRRPLLIDEMAQLWQAQRYAEWRLWIPPPPHREFFSFLHLVDLGDKVYSQFPPGGPFMLWFGVLVGAPWLVGPVCGALCVWLFSRLARAVEPHAGDGWVLGATLLFAVTPFGVFMFGSHMNHVTALLWILVAVVALVHLIQVDSTALPPKNAEKDRTRTGDPSGFLQRWSVSIREIRGEAVVPALLVGFGLGAAATIRPLDAFAFALPAAIWLVVRAGRSPQRWLENILAGCGIAVPFAAMMYVNVQTTGHPLLFGYEVLWGVTHGLGFHAAPWGVPHTPLRGLALASLYQWRLQSYLFEAPFPSLLLPVISLLLAKRVSALDRYLLASSALVILFYLLYWHDGFFLGPRFVVPLLPALVLWTARLPRALAERVHSVHARAGLSAALAFGVVGALVFNLPVRISSYRAGLTSMRVDYAHAAEQAGVRDALVFVRESWGAELVARLWALGVSHPKTEAIYRGVDACNLEREITSLEREGVRGPAAEARLAVLVASDSASVVGSDFTEHMRSGVQYTPVCLQRIADDRGGFLHLPPLRLVTTGNNVYARDLQAHDSLLLAQFPKRRVYLLRRAGTQPDDPLEYLPLSRDSLFAAWRGAR